MSMTMLLPLGIIYLAKDIDWTDETNANNCRILFFTVHAAIIACYFYIQTIITKNNDRTTVSDGVTVMDHDLAQVKKQLSTTLITLGIMTFINYKFEAYVPLLMQSVMNPVNIYKHKLFQLYILGDASSENTTRPWVEKVSLFGQDATPAPENTDTAPENKDDKKIEDKKETKEPKQDKKESKESKKDKKEPKKDK